MGVTIEFILDVKVAAWCNNEAYSMVLNPVAYNIDECE